MLLQLVKQTRGNVNGTSKTKAWQLFYMTAATMPPSKDFTSLVSGEAPGPGAASATAETPTPVHSLCSNCRCSWWVSTALPAHCSEGG